MYIQVNQKLKMEYRAGPKSTGDKIRRCLHNSLPKKINDTSPILSQGKVQCTLEWQLQCVCVCVCACVNYGGGYQKLGRGIEKERSHSFEKAFVSVTQHTAPHASKCAYPSTTQLHPAHQHAHRGFVHMQHTYTHESRTPDAPVLRTRDGGLKIFYG